MYEKLFGRANNNFLADFEKGMKKRKKGTMDTETLACSAKQKILSGLLALLLLITMAGVLSLSPQKAYAATANLSVGKVLNYGGSYTTNEFYVDNTHFAYCAQPSKNTPAAGSYTVTKYADSQGLKTSGSYGAFYFGYGGPGFDKSHWPTFYGGGSWSEANYMTTTHVIISDKYAADLTYALTGTTQEFRDWYSWNISGMNGAVNVNPNSLYMKFKNMYEALPQEIRTDFEKNVFVLQTGDTQDILYWNYVTPGKIDLRKVSSVPTMTDGNNCYDLSKAEYSVYKSKSDAESNTDKVTTIKLDSSGWGSTDWLPVGDYYVKETKAGTNFELDSTVYPVSVKAAETTRVNKNYVTDKPCADPTHLQIYKYDKDLGPYQGPIGDVKSLSGAEFTVKYFDNTSDSISGSPKKTWIFSTDNNGYINMHNPSYKTGGDSLYFDELGAITYPIGTYSFQETKAPKDYLLNTDVSLGRVANVSGVGVFQKINGNWIDGLLTQRQVPATPDPPVKVGVKIQKHDSRSNGTPQGDAWLTGIKFNLRNDSLHAISYKDVEYAPGESIENFFVTDAKGQAYTGASWDATVDKTLPVGTYTIYESGTNESMLNTSNSYKLVVPSGVEDGKVFDLSDTPFKDEVVRGDVKIQKYDAELPGDGEDNNPALGGSTVSEAVFEITNISKNSVYIYDNADDIPGNEGWYKPGEVCATIITNSGKYGGLAQTKNRALPYGTYQIREVKAPVGYFGTNKVVTIEIRENGKVYDLTNRANSFINQVKRGDIEGTKVEDSTGKRMANIPFEIRSNATGETHVIVTDRNGYFASSSSWNKHSYKTNYNDKYLSGDITADQLDPEAGIWFSWAQDHSQEAPVNDNAGAFPYDTDEKYPITGITTSGYTLTELECPANEGKIMLKVNFHMYKDKVVVDLDTMENEPAYELTVDKLDADTEQPISGVEFELLNAADRTVYASWVQPDGEYKINNIPKGNYLLIETKTVDGYAISKQEFSITISGAVYKHYFAVKDEPTKLEVIKYSEDGSMLSGAFMQLMSVDEKEADRKYKYDESGKVIADSRETEISLAEALRFEEEAFLSLTNEDLDKIIEDLLGALNAAAIEFQLDINDMVDAITNTSRAEAWEYMSTTTLSLVDEYGVSGNIAATFMTMNDTYTFPYLPQGTYKLMELQAPVTHEVPHFEPVLFTVDENGLVEGESTITISLDNKPLEIKTTALDGENGTHESDAAGNVTIIDTVEYRGLRVGEKYTMSGTLMNKETEMPLVVPVDENNPSIEPGEYKQDWPDLELPTGYTIARTNVEFVPESESGTVDLTYTFNGEILAGTTVVVFEDLYLYGVNVATHHDLSDLDQTIELIKIGTTALDQDNKTHHSAATNQVTIVDTVEYTNLAPGTTYKISGVLMDSTPDENGVPANKELLVHDKPVISEIEFVPDEPNGFIEMVFTFDASEFAGQTTTVFERLYNGEVKVAEHADIEDEGQTVSLVKIGTKAKDKDSGKNEGVTSEDTTIVDTVSYQGLIPGNTYTVKGILYLKESGKPLEVGDTQIEAETTFKPEKSSGEVELEFTFDSTVLNGQSVVVFEYLYFEDKLIAEHAEINDKDQTVTYWAPKTPGEPGDKSVLDKTFDWLSKFWWVVVLILAAGSTFVAMGVRKKKLAGVLPETTEATEVVEEESAEDQN